MSIIDGLSNLIPRPVNTDQGSNAISQDTNNRISDQTTAPDGNKLEEITKGLGKVGEVAEPVIKYGGPIVGNLCTFTFGTIEPWVEAGGRLLADGGIELVKMTIGEVSNLAASEAVSAVEGATFGEFVPG